MAQPESLAYLQEQLQHEIKSFDGSRQWYRSAYFWFTLSGASLSAITTVLIGAGPLVGDSHHALALLALICSGATTILAAYEGFLKSKDFWLHKTDAWMQLITLNSQIDYALAKGPTPLPQAEIDDFYGRFEQVLFEEHEGWKRLRNASQPASNYGRMEKKPKGEAGTTDGGG